MNNKFDDVTDVVDEHAGQEQEQADHAGQANHDDQYDQDAKLKSMLLQILKDG